jgi:hypothetical protein
LRKPRPQPAACSPLSDTPDEKPGVTRLPDSSHQNHQGPAHNTARLRSGRSASSQGHVTPGPMGPIQDAVRAPRVRPSRAPPRTPAGSAARASGALAAPVVGTTQSSHIASPNIYRVLGRLVHIMKLGGPPDPGPRERSGPRRRGPSRRDSCFLIPLVKWGIALVLGCRSGRWGFAIGASRVWAG